MIFILLLYGLCHAAYGLTHAQIRDGAHLNLISNKVEALEKIVTSLENSISKLEVSRVQFWWRKWYLQGSADAFRAKI